jgi:hypothetical protein
MAIRNVGDPSSPGAVTPAASEQHVRRQSSAPPPALGAAASARISKAGELFSKLQQLQQQDPEKFKEVVSNIAQSLRDAAEQAPNRGAAFLNQLADRFDKAAETGELAAPQSQVSQSSDSVAGRQHHRHHGHHGDGAVASALQNAFTQAEQALSAINSPPATTPAVPPAETTDPAATPAVPPAEVASSATVAGTTAT